MNYRRQPFQFTTIDPAKRHAELQKRFGFPSNSTDMYVDGVIPGIMGAGGYQEPTIAGSSPRLQHRVPIFNSTADENVDTNVDSGHKPKVRVIPIQVEGVDAPTKRHRTFSGPASSVNEEPSLKHEPLKQSAYQNATPNLCNASEPIRKPGQPRVCNIPIQIEPRPVKKSDPEHKPKKVENKPERIVEIKKEKPNVSKPIKVDLSQVKLNGCAPSKEPEKPKEPDVNIPLKQIEDVLGKLNTYRKEVEEFSGTSKDKKYRYLDEMLTRCMLDLDNVDTLGMDNIRQSRKAAVRQVQHCIDLLETKISLPSSNPEPDIQNITNNVNMDTAEVTETSSMEVSESSDETKKEKTDSQSKADSVSTNSVSMEVNEPVVQEVNEEKLTAQEKPSNGPTVEDVSEMSDQNIAENSNPIIQEAGEETVPVIQEASGEKTLPVIDEVEDVSNLPAEQITEIEISEVQQDVGQGDFSESNEHSAKDVEMEEKPVEDGAASENLEEMEVVDICSSDQETKDSQLEIEPIITEPSELVEATSQQTDTYTVEQIDAEPDSAPVEVNSVDCELSDAITETSVELICDSVNNVSHPSSINVSEVK